MRYRVHVWCEDPDILEVDEYLNIEADSPEEAEEKALEEFLHIADEMNVDFMAVVE